MMYVDETSTGRRCATLGDAAWDGGQRRGSGRRENSEKLTAGSMGYSFIGISVAIY